MYSVVLMMAFTTGGDTPAIGHRGGGCQGGCYGGGSGGCHGGGRSRGHHGGGCCGCSGGGYGGGYGGCYGGMGMGYGGGCMGSGMGMGYGSGCMGSGMGMGSSMGYGCMGSGMGMGMSYGCMGMGMGMGMGQGCQGGMMMPSTTTPGTTPEGLKTKPKEKKDGTMAPAPATIVVELPADAKLLIDNAPTTTTGTSRVFVSPDLNPGREYHYTLKAEIVQDGKSVQVEKVIAVRAGEITPTTLTLPPAGVAQR